MFQTLKNAWSMPELRKKMLYTLFIILIFRFGSCIPVPFIDTTLLSQYFEQASVNGSMLGYLDMFTGGGLSRATIFAMSITPYINASIIIQLLTVAIPALERMVKDGGEEGREKIASWTRYLGVLLGLLQGLSYYALLRNGFGGKTMLSNTGALAAVTIIVTFTAGTALDNAPSRRLLESLGFVLQGTRQLSFHQDASGRAISFVGGVFRKAGNLP